MPRSAADPKHWPAAWHTVEGAVEAGAEAGEAIKGFDLARLGIGTEDLAGARFGPDGVTTLYFNVSFDGLEATLPGLPSTGRGRASVIGELTLDGSGPRAVALREVVPSEGNSRHTETVYRVSLHGGAPPAPWAIVREARRAGAVERNVYSYSDTTRGVSGSFALGLKFGADAKLVNIRRALIDATARTPGSARERERFDCLDQLR
jgi:hypothetical protein